MTFLLILLTAADLATMAPVDAYLNWLDAYHKSDGKMVYELYNQYGQSMCREKAGSDDPVKLGEAALFFACRLLYQEDPSPSKERVMAKWIVESYEISNESSCFITNGDGDMVVLMNEGKGWKVDNVFSREILHPEKK